MSASAAEQTLSVEPVQNTGSGPTGARKGTVIGALLLGAFVFSLNARGTILESAVIVQAYALDRYRIQWITGAEGVASLEVAMRCLQGDVTPAQRKPRRVVG